VSTRVAQERPDVLVIEGGVVEVPGDVKFGIDFGFPKGTAYACMCETMMLALENRPESYDKHGFKLAGFRSFEKETGEADIARAKAARRSSSGPDSGRAVPRLAPQGES
jgi:hypothetical protein